MTIFNSYVSLPEGIENKLHRHRPQIDKVGTDGSQRGNQRLPLQGITGSQRLELIFLEAKQLSL